MANSVFSSVKCVAVKDNNLTLLKVYAVVTIDNKPKMYSVSVPKDFREKLTEKQTFECDLHFSKDERFLVAEGLGKQTNGKSNSKAEKEAFELLTAK